MLINNRRVKCRECLRLIPAGEPYCKMKKSMSKIHITCINCYVGLSYEDLLISFRPLLRQLIFDHEFLTLSVCRLKMKHYRLLSGFETVQLLEYFGFIKLITKTVILKEKEVYIADPEMIWTNRKKWEEKYEQNISV